MRTSLDSTIKYLYILQENNSQLGIYIDSADNLYIADMVNHKIRKIDTSGIITTVAGNGHYTGIVDIYKSGGVWYGHSDIGFVGAFSGKGTPATQASLSFPTDVWGDQEGHIYFADSDNHRIRKINIVTGMILTIVGDGWRHSEHERLSSDFNGSYYVGNGENQGGYTSPQRNGRYSGDGQHAQLASLNAPTGIHIDHLGNLYIADTDNNRIRKVEGFVEVNVTLTEGQSADFDSDGLVGFPDFLFFVTQFGKIQTDTDFDTRSDLNRDGSIDFADFIAFANQFGKAS